MFRVIVWAFLELFLIVVGLWPAAATPIELAGAGLDAVIAAIPGPVLLAAAVVLYFRHRPHTA
jgi:hypothetical protein